MNVSYLLRKTCTNNYQQQQGGGLVVRWCWVNFQCRGVLLIWSRVGQGPTALAVGAGGGCLDIFSLVYQFSLLSPSLRETARYRLKYCLKGPLSPKQPTNQQQQNQCLLFPHGFGRITNFGTSKYDMQRHPSLKTAHSCYM